MSKGQTTKENIIIKAATLFNTKGYAGSSMADLMTVTGLKKGGIYNHFHTKEEILLEAFDYSIKQITQALTQVIKSHYTATDKLKAVVNFYCDYALNPIIHGGCPILNSTVEADDNNPLLKKRVQTAMANWVDILSRMILRGIKRREFEPDIDVEAAAIYIVAALEGGIAMTRSFNDDKYMQIIANQLLYYIDTELKS